MNATRTELAQRRDEAYRALPKAGRDAQGKLVLFAAAAKVTSEEIDQVILDDGVQWELTQTPVDARGLMQAVESASLKSAAGALYGALANPEDQFMFLSLIGRL